MSQEKTHYNVSEIASSTYCEQQTVFFKQLGKKHLPSVNEAAIEGIAQHAEFEKKGRKIQKTGSENKNNRGRRHYRNKEQDPRCFIATCVFGNDALETNILRDWRDQRLSHYVGGAFFIKCYYFISPRLIPIINASPLLKNGFRAVLDTLVNVIKKGL